MYNRSDNIKRKFHNSIKFNISPPITPVPTFQHRDNVGIDCNTKVKLARFYYKSPFTTSISTFVKSIKTGHFATWPNLNSNIIQNILPKITATSKGHLNKVYQNIQSTKNFKLPELPITKEDPNSDPIIKEELTKKWDEEINQDTLLDENQLSLSLSLVPITAPR